MHPHWFANTHMYIYHNDDCRDTAFQVVTSFHICGLYMLCVAREYISSWRNGACDQVAFLINSHCCRSISFITTDSVEQNVLREANSLPPIQQILRLLWNPKVHCHIQKFVIMALQPFFGPWPLFQFLDTIQIRYDSLDGRSYYRKAAIYTQYDTNTE
jgi:hypothetical protein